VSAASIVAKVARDRYMAEQDERYPGYDFSKHAGYGVAKHRAAIETLGVTPLHRLSFAPLAKYRIGVPVASGSRNEAETAATTRQIGNLSEQAACDFLVSKGHTIVERNWRTRWCEIDIISLKQSIYYFTEVKHRRNDVSGDGLAAITATKLKQMKFAAELYAVRQPVADLRLAVIATTGDPAEVTEFLQLS
jgi:ribonuclease HII